MHAVGLACVEAAPAVARPLLEAVVRGEHPAHVDDVDARARGALGAHDRPVHRAQDARQGAAARDRQRQPVDDRAAAAAIDRIIDRARAAYALIQAGPQQRAAPIGKPSLGPIHTTVASGWMLRACAAA